VLLHLLGDPIPVHARLRAEDPVALLRQGSHCPTLLDRLAHLGVCESPYIRGPFHFARYSEGGRLFLGVFNGAERVAWVLRHLSCEHPRFHGRLFQSLGHTRTLWILIGVPS